MKSEEFSKYEFARILGARALQIAMNAPILINLSKEDLEKIKYDSLKVAEIELNSNILPISIKKPFPKKKEEKLKRIAEVKVSDQKLEEKESTEEKEIVKEGEIMEIATPEDELEADVSDEVGEAE